MNSFDYLGTTTRAVPAGNQQSADALPRVWIFGGSTTHEVRTTDADSWVNQFASTLREAGHPAKIFNFGCAGFGSSLEVVKLIDLLRRAPAHDLPDHVIFYDGANEPGNDHVPPHWLAGHLLFVNRRYLSLAAYALHRSIAGHCYIWRELVTPLLKTFRIRPAAAAPSEPERAAIYGNAEKYALIYSRNVQIARSVCCGFGISPLFIFQPTIYTKAMLSPFEEEISLRGRESFLRMRTEVVNAMKGNPDFLDLSHMLDGRACADFYDDCHMGGLSSRFVGREIGRYFLERYSNETAAKRSAR